MRVLLIDNYDSFTYNVVQLVRMCGGQVDVVRNDEGTAEAILRDYKPYRIIISPGPGAPKDSGNSCAVIHMAARNKIPLLGICLGHQCLGAVFGAKIIHAPLLLHGKTSRIMHNGLGLLKGLPSPFIAARYHSLVLKNVPKDFLCSVWTQGPSDKRLIMGIQHKTLPLFGLQFHPESFMTEHGTTMMKHFLAPL